MPETREEFAESYALCMHEVQQLAEELVKLGATRIYSPDYENGSPPLAVRVGLSDPTICMSVAVCPDRVGNSRITRNGKPPGMAETALIDMKTGSVVYDTSDGLGYDDVMSFSTDALPASSVQTAKKVFQEITRVQKILSARQSKK